MVRYARFDWSSQHLCVLQHFIPLDASPTSTRCHCSLGISEFKFVVHGRFPNYAPNTNLEWWTQLGDVDNTNLASWTFFNTENGTISGQPLQPSLTQNYTIQVQNASGKAEIPLRIEVVDVPPVVSLSPLTYVFKQGFRIPPMNLSNTGGNITHLFGANTGWVNRNFSGQGKLDCELDKQVCFSTSTGTYCASEGGLSHEFTTTGAQYGLNWK